MDEPSCASCFFSDYHKSQYPCSICDRYYKEYVPMPSKDAVSSPQHYADHYPFEVKEAIELILNTYGKDLTPYQNYCLGNELKYRLRAGFKDDIKQEINKALKYKEFRDESTQCS